MSTLYDDPELDGYTGDYTDAEKAPAKLEDLTASQLAEHLRGLGEEAQDRLAELEIPDALKNEVQNLLLADAGFEAILASAAKITPSVEQAADIVAGLDEEQADEFLHALPDTVRHAVEDRLQRLEAVSASADLLDESTMTVVGRDDPQYDRAVRQSDAIVRAGVQKMQRGQLVASREVRDRVDQLHDAFETMSDGAALQRAASLIQRTEAAALAGAPWGATVSVRQYTAPDGSVRVVETDDLGRTRETARHSQAEAKAAVAERNERRQQPVGSLADLADLDAAGLYAVVKNMDETTRERLRFEASAQMEAAGRGDEIVG